MVNNAAMNLNLPIENYSTEQGGGSTWKINKQDVNSSDIKDEQITDGTLAFMFIVSRRAVLLGPFTQNKHSK